MSDGEKPASTGKGPGGRTISVKAVIWFVAAVLLIWFAVANWKRVEVRWWVFSTESPLFLVIIVAAGLGIVVDRLVIHRRGRKKD
jgi:uncharacterized integral membrane protein